MSPSSRHGRHERGYAPEPTTGPESGAKVAASTERPAGGGRPGHGGMGVVQKPKSFGPSLKRLLARLASDRPFVALVVLLGLVGVGMSVYAPKVLGRAMNLVFAGFAGAKMGPGMTRDELIAHLHAVGQDTQADMFSTMTDLVPGQGIDFDALGRVLLLALGLYVIASVFQWAQGLLATTIVQRTARRLREDVEAKFERLPLAYFDRSARGEILSRATNDIDNVAQTLQQTMTQLLNSLLTVVGVIVMMLTISPMLTLVALVTIPVMAGVTMAVAKRSQPQYKEQWAATGRLNGHVEEMFTGAVLVKVYGQQENASKTFAVHNDALYESAFKAQFVSGLIMPAMWFVSNLNYVAVAVIGGLRVAGGHISIGDVQAFIQYSRQFSQPLGQLASMSNLLQSGVASAERVFELLDAEEETPSAAGRLPERIEGRIAFEDVSFAYDPAQPLIEHLDLLAEPGATVAIVGPTGAGKTTLTNLLLRFYEIDGGRITVDGHDIRSVDREDLRERFGVVLQDAWLFKGTIRDNIAYGATNPTEEQVVAAAVAASADHFVRTLPDGYDTIIDDEGSNVSAGQRQLLTIARAFCSDPEVLILDEATSSVDTRTEKQVQEAMERLRTGRTSFVIAHRLSTIRDADRIVVMEDGHIVEQGTHDELLAREDGAYARLYGAQFAGSATP